MNDHELRKFMGRVTVADNRQVDTYVLAHWRETIGMIAYDDAVQALNMHFMESTEYLMPAHIIRGVRRIREDRALNRADDEENLPIEGHPKPLNMEAMQAAHDRGDPVAYAREVSIYNQQLIDAGYPDGEPYQPRYSARHRKTRAA